MTDEQLQQMDIDELEMFLQKCVEQSEKVGVDLDYYIMEFV